MTLFWGRTRRLTEVVRNGRAKRKPDVRMNSPTVLDELVNITRDELIAADAVFRVDGTIVAASRRLLLRPLVGRRVELGQLRLGFLDQVDGPLGDQAEHDRVGILLQRRRVSVQQRLDLEVDALDRGTDVRVTQERYGLV